MINCLTIKAFRSTLEEACEADLIIHVVDCSDKDYRRQIEVTERTLKEIGVWGIPIIYALNKADKLDIKPASERPDSVYISAKYRTGLDTQLGLIKKRLFGNYVRCNMLIPYKDGDVVSYLNQNANIIRTEYDGDGTRLSLELRESDFNRFKKFVVSRHK